MWSLFVLCSTGCTRRMPVVVFALAFTHEHRFLCDSVTRAFWGFQMVPAFAGGLGEHENHSSGESGELPDSPLELIITDHLT